MQFGLPPTLYKLFQVVCVCEMHLSLPYAHFRTQLLRAIHALIIRPGLSLQVSVRSDIHHDITNTYPVVESLQYVIFHINTKILCHTLGSHPSIVLTLHFFWRCLIMGMVRVETISVRFIFSKLATFLNAKNQMGEYVNLHTKGSLCSYLVVTCYHILALKLGCKVFLNNFCMATAPQCGESDSLVPGHCVCAQSTQSCPPYHRWGPGISARRDPTLPLRCSHGSPCSCHHSQRGLSP